MECFGGHVVPWNERFLGLIGKSGERGCDLGDVWDEPVAVINRPEETTKFCYSFWQWEVTYGFKT